MSRSVIMVTCPKCGHTFPAKEEKGLVRKLIRVGVLAGAGFIIGGPIGAGVGALGGSAWGALETECSCPKCGESIDRPEVQ